MKWCWSSRVRCWNLRQERNCLKSMKGETEEEKLQPQELYSTGTKESRMMPTAGEESSERQGLWTQEFYSTQKEHLHFSCVGNSISHSSPKTRRRRQRCLSPSDCPEPQGETMGNGEAKQTTWGQSKCWRKTKEQQHIHTTGFRSSELIIRKHVGTAQVQAYLPFFWNDLSWD